VHSSGAFAGGDVGAKFHPYPAWATMQSDDHFMVCSAQLRPSSCFQPTRQRPGDKGQPGSEDLIFAGLRLLDAGRLGQLTVATIPLGPVGT